jgi:hypothetical protein
MKHSITKATDRQIKANLKSWINAASIQNENDGREWYSEAQAFTRKLAKTYGIDSYVVASVISALSPNNKWERNKVDAVTVIEAFNAGLTSNDVKVCTYTANKEKAFSILSGKVEIVSKSPKTHAFAMNVGLLSSSHITIDKWMVRAALLRPNKVEEVVESISPANYRRVERIAATLASNEGVKGFQLQAIIWVSIKENWGR